MKEKYWLHSKLISEALWFAFKPRALGGFSKNWRWPSIGFKTSSSETRDALSGDLIQVSYADQWPQPLAVTGSNTAMQNVKKNSEIHEAWKGNSSQNIKIVLTLVYPQSFGVPISLVWNISEDILVSKYVFPLTGVPLERKLFAPNRTIVFIHYSSALNSLEY